MASNSRSQVLINGNKLGSNSAFQSLSTIHQQNNNYYGSPEDHGKNNPSQQETKSSKKKVIRYSIYVLMPVIVLIIVLSVIITQRPQSSTSSPSTSSAPISSYLSATSDVGYTGTSPTATHERQLTTITTNNGLVITGLVPRETCWSDSECLPSNFCYTNQALPAPTCCDASISGCPGASCRSHEDCLDPFPCHKYGSLGTCCGYPPYTWAGPSCYATTTPAATATATDAKTS